ncbi:hypothetical protein EIP91_009748 [Steccherinum ochraceum]|uniref:Uncharacterized protein n=1 Tax=Steccherinum ochraceum TaxID=92696 RepID=A0A4R0R1A0_9APHY|nr:hypothetical protein EIP91_009748 [Steccherinum ochraceum]
MSAIISTVAQLIPLTVPETGIYIAFEIRFFLKEDENGGAILKKAIGRYFNAPGWDFDGAENRVGFATISPATLKANTVFGKFPALEGQDLSQYLFMGDIHCFVPIPQLDQGLPHGCAPYLMAGGHVQNTNSSDFTWDIALSDFYCLGDPASGSVTIKSAIPNTKRWSKRDKVMPKSGSPISQHGPVTDMQQCLDGLEIHTLINDLGYIKKTVGAAVSRSGSGSELSTPMKVAPPPKRAAQSQDHSDSGSPAKRSK